MSLVADTLIKIQEVGQSRLPEVDFENLTFGNIFSDHMFEVDFNDGEWREPVIKPYQEMKLSPACSALHYGQSIFEGMKAYKSVDGKIQLFRPDKNAKRFNISANRMSMPSIPESLFLDALHTLVGIDKVWTPNQEGHSLYIRPFMFANDPFIGVRTSTKYKFVVFTCPVGKYYSKRIKVKVANQYVRAFKGGTGFAKAAGNYAATLYPALLVGKEGFDQVLWTDGYEHKYVQEIGTMNFFCIIDGVAYTPPTDGQILEGVTRASVITLLKDEGYTVKEQPVTIQEIDKAFDAGKLDDAFGTGTAASVSPIAEINFEGKSLIIDEHKSISEKIKNRLNNIKYGREADPFNWMVTVV